MTDYIGIASFSTEEARLHISASMPSGWRLEEGSTPYFFWAQVVSPEGDILFEATHIDRRIMLISVYCYLLIKDKPKVDPGSSVWARRGELTSREVTRKVMSSAKDPEDLDPEEIKSVYDQICRKGK